MININLLTMDKGELKGSTQSKLLEQKKLKKQCWQVAEQLSHDYNLNPDCIKKIES